ncbi:MAG: 16S rRNA (uracil(1498)-N(3))-methyltransferase [Simkaniaceae bacterium]|nr:16S rRNA (uracil(1498)-N(3))-methyltransferase [Simkaniaceae bacterium]
MPNDRFYIDTQLEGTLSLEGEEFNHLSRVMRKKVGDFIELVNGMDASAKAKVLEISKKEALLEVMEVKTFPPLLSKLTLIQALPKMHNLELILQKGCEIGATDFYLYPSNLSEKKELSNNQQKRLSHILIGAMKQCGRLDLPKIHFGFPPLNGPTYFGDLSENAPLLSSLHEKDATLIIGPEKGFTESEIQELRKKAIGVKITPYTLRAETAAIAGLAILASKEL